MRFRLPDLPYALDALEPVLSAETLRLHHGKHHAGYIEKLNAAVDEHAGGLPDSLPELVRACAGDKASALFQNGAQAWNHDFYWHGMTPGGRAPQGALTSALKSSFGGIDALRDRFLEAAAGHFGSGWAWLVQVNSGELAVLSTHDADNPLRTGQTPLLTCDVWEHAYYIDYRNKRQDYVEAWWKLADWSFVKQNLAVGASAE